MRIESAIQRHGGYIERLRKSYVASTGQPFRALDRETSFVCIAAWNCWCEFGRDLVQLTMNGGTHKGVPIGWRVQAGDWRTLCYQELTGKHFSGQRREEPRWGNTDILRRIAKAMDFGNQAIITNALSAKTRCLLDLPVVRNYYAHRNESTKKAANRLYLVLGVPAQHDPTRLLVSKTNIGTFVLEDWLIDLELTIRLFG